jgi:hypothetical protein
MSSEMNDLWLFIEWGKNNTWTRATVPAGVATIRDLLGHLQRGGRVESPWLDLPDRARFTPRAVGMTVIATLAEMENK